MTRPGRRGTLLPGRTASPWLIYLGVVGAMSGLQMLAFTTYGLYAVKEAGLSPLQLVLVGTALEAAVVVSEAPTGVLADAYSRRLSVLVGVAIVGVGFLLIAIEPTFLFIALGQAVWGLGFTFVSGALQAWLSDEIGESAAAPIYLRGTQVALASSLLGIPVGAAIASTGLAWPMVVAACGHWLLALSLLAAMGEAGYTPAGASHPLRAMATTFRAGVGAVRGRPTLMTILLVTVVLGAASEAFDRLWALHLIDNVGLSGDLDDVVWFGIIVAGANVGGIVLAGVARRATDLDDPRQIVRALLVLIAALTGVAFVFALSDALWLALASMWAAAWIRETIHPLTLVWINRGLDPRTRATVISILSQGDAVGQLAGGPALGGVGAVGGVRAALLGVGVLTAPALALYGRVWARGERLGEQPAS